MAFVTKRKIKGKYRYYLEKSFRLSTGKINKISIYLKDYSEDKKDEIIEKYGKELEDKENKLMTKTSTGKEDKMKLWHKGIALNKEIEKFTVGQDYLLDEKLAYADCLGNIAHAATLKKSGILTNAEFIKLKKELKSIIALAEEGKFKISPEQEDVHTAVENYLTEKLGNLGKKIHTARSRNDQVIVDTRLYTKQKLLKIEDEIFKLIKALLKKAKQNEFVAMPGYTHMQKAMPSSVGMWLGSFAEAITDDLELVNSTYELNDQCPLGSAAGYGVSINLDRAYTAQLLGFGKVQKNSIYVQNSRGKIELAVLNSLNNVMIDLNKLASDMVLFTMSEFDYIKLPDRFTTGSSIMPQKKNPDVAELVKAKSAVMAGYVVQINSLLQNLISGYHRNLQLTKEPLIDGLETAEETIKIMALVVDGLIINKEKCIKACTEELFAADYAYELVKKGTPFRDAYKFVGENLNKLKKIYPVKNIKSKTNIGATGNLGLDETLKNLNNYRKSFMNEKNSFESKIKSLVA